MVGRLFVNLDRGMARELIVSEANAAAVQAVEDLEADALKTARCASCARSLVHSLMYSLVCSFNSKLTSP